MRPAALLAALAVAGCGTSDDRLRVSAASSLRPALGGEDVAISFAGSDQLAAQIRAGSRPDVIATAGESLPRALFEEGLVERPVTFAGNRIVLAVPADGARVRALGDLLEPGVRIAVAAPGVPAGDYARAVLDRLDERAALNVRSEEPDVGAVAGKVAQGAVDAGFVYATDVRAAGGRMREIDIPAAIAPTVRYAAAVVKGGERIERARSYVQRLRTLPALERAGFERP